MGADDPWLEAYPGDDDPWRIFDSAGIDELTSAPDVDSREVEEVFDYANEKKRAKISRLNAENDMRTTFFAWSSKLAGWVVALNMVIFIAYLAIQAFAPGKIPDAVMLAWIAGTVVEILGIVAIVARHLFPGRKWQTGNVSTK